MTKSTLAVLLVALAVPAGGIARVDLVRSMAIEADGRTNHLIRQQLPSSDEASATAGSAAMSCPAPKNCYHSHWAHPCSQTASESACAASGGEWCGSTSGEKACAWTTHGTSYSGGYADGVSTSFSLADAKRKCIELGTSKCKGVTCNSSGGSCTVRGSSSLKYSGWEKTYVPSPDCFQEPQDEEEGEEEEHTDGGASGEGASGEGGAGAAGGASGEGDGGSGATEPVQEACPHKACLICEKCVNDYLTLARADTCKQQGYPCHLAEWCQLHAIHAVGVCQHGQTDRLGKTVISSCISQLMCASSHYTECSAWRDKNCAGEDDTFIEELLTGTVSSAVALAERRTMMRRSGSIGKDAEGNNTSINTPRSLTEERAKGSSQIKATESLDDSLEGKCAA